MIDRENEDGSGAATRGWAPAHSWRWFLIRAAKHVPKAGKDQPQRKFLGAQFFAILQAVGQAANEDGTNAFLGIDTLMAVGRCSKDTVQKVLIAAESMQLIRKTANARGGRNPKPATYACTFPLGADTETGRGLDWERALIVLSSSEHDRRLRHKRAVPTGRHMKRSEEAAPEAQEASSDAACDDAAMKQEASHDHSTGRHVTDQRASGDASTRGYQALHHEEAAAVDPPQVDAAAPAKQDSPSPDAGMQNSPSYARQGLRAAPDSAAANYQGHVATCDRCPREIWCPEGSRLRRYLAREQHQKRARYLGANGGS
ncbi:hypothetical protein K7B10_39170 [Streptomyces flavotricini]|uniref:Uncharacterized protein n=1 Tax=Streptomyces flavotricini TaxID=66888 RepID=A0ABS8EIV9_9ACTN|nr:hypothetical protein [Streptomyces flavotricini]MCC0100674.1 hypothetical protein [Streptomyces flavotricini]